MAHSFQRGEGGFFGCGDRFAARVAQASQDYRRLHRALLTHVETVHERNAVQFYLFHIFTCISGNPVHATDLQLELSLRSYGPVRTGGYGRTGPRNHVQGGDKPLTPLNVPPQCYPC
jgi:hypothetical protein